VIIKLIIRFINKNIINYIMKRSVFIPTQLNLNGGIKNEKII
jgi:hypothetical protein